MRTERTEQDIRFYERLIGIRVAKLMAALSCIVIPSYAYLVANQAFFGNDAIQIIMSFAVTIPMSIIIGMALVLLIVDRLTQAHFCPLKQLRP